jgi:hypothetical protein
LFKDGVVDAFVRVEGGDDGGVYSFELHEGGSSFKCQVPSFNCNYYKKIFSVI